MACFICPKVPRRRLLSYTFALLAIFALVIPGLAHSQSNEEQKIFAIDGATGDAFGETVSISGDVAVVGARNDNDTGSAYVFRHSGGAWTQEAKLTASDADTGDQFGSSVSVSGDVAVVGAFLDDDAGGASGSAYVFRHNGGTWTQEAKLAASDGASGDSFGASASVSGDVAVVGAYGDSNQRGAAFVFRYKTGLWRQEAKLTASDLFAGDQFSRSVSVSGGVIVVGAPRDSDAGSSSGSAYVFRHRAGTWPQEAKLTANDAATGDRFGSSVSVSGEVTIVGATYDGEVVSNSGSAYVFRHSAGTWAQETKLAASDAAADDFFGSVAIDASVMVVGAHNGDGVAADTGSAYTFVVPGADFLRGDSDGDGFFNALTDAIFTLSSVFVPGSPFPVCPEAADADENTIFNGLVDGIFMLNFRFVPGSPPLTAPFPDCGPDPDLQSSLGCATNGCP